MFNEIFKWFLAILITVVANGIVALVYYAFHWLVGTLGDIVLVVPLMLFVAFLIKKVWLDGKL